LEQGLKPKKMCQTWYILSRNSPESLSGIETGVKSIDYKLFGVQPFQSECDRGNYTQAKLINLNNLKAINPGTRFPGMKLVWKGWKCCYCVVSSPRDCCHRGILLQSDNRWKIRGRSQLNH